MVLKALLWRMHVRWSTLFRVIKLLLRHMYVAIQHVLLWISYETRGLFLCSVNSNYYNVQIYLKTASEKTWPINTDTETKHTGSNSPVCIYHRHESLIAATTVLSNISRVMHELSRVMHPHIYILSRVFLIFLVSMGHFLFKFIDRFSWSRPPWYHWSHSLGDAASYLSVYRTKVFVLFSFLGFFVLLVAL